MSPNNPEPNSHTAGGIGTALTLKRTTPVVPTASVK